MNRKRHRKRKRLKRIIIAYLLRVILILILAGMITLMVCGCIYIYDCFTKEDVVTTNADNHPVTYEDNADNVPISEEMNQVSEFCVVIDAGHGGSDGGTVNGKIVEKDINLSVASRMKAVLEENNIEVILTRNSDENVSLAQRISIANEASADFFISLHCNYYEDDSQIAGLECYYSNPEATESKAYAESIINATSLSNDIITRSAKSLNYYVLKNTTMPAVLVEMGFLSNNSECQKLSDDDYQEILAQRIAEGILQEYNRGHPVV